MHPRQPNAQGPQANLDAPGPAGEWADAVLSSALGTISNDGLSALR